MQHIVCVKHNDIIHVMSMEGVFPIVGAGSLSPRKGRDLWTKLRTTLNQVSKYYHCILIDSIKIFGHHPLKMFILLRPAWQMFWQPLVLFRLASETPHLLPCSVTHVRGCGLSVLPLC